MGGTCKTLTLAEIGEINRLLIAEFGGIYFAGDYNQQNPGSLEHVLEQIQGSLFGHDAYPSLLEKAAALAWRINTSHVFHDGNKRTAMESCRVFLYLNGYQMRIDAEVTHMALAIAAHEVTFDAFVEWLRARCVRSELSDQPSLDVTSDDARG
jgi:death-on-curing protein